MNSINQDTGFVGTGTPYFTPAAAGAATFFFGNPISASVALSSEKIERKSRKKENAGAVLDAITRPNPPEVTLSTDTFIPRTWAMALMGTAATVEVAAKPAADEAAVARLDGYHRLTKRDIDPATVVVKKGATTLTAAQFTLNAEAGLLQITDATAANEGDALTVNYQTKAVKKLVIDGAKVTNFKGKVEIDGKNEITGQRARLIFPNLTLAVEGDFDWYNEGYNTVVMKGTAAVGSNGEPPYTVELYD